MQSTECDGTLRLFFCLEGVPSEVCAQGTAMSSAACAGFASMKLLVDVCAMPSLPAQGGNALHGVLGKICGRHDV